MDPLQPNRNKGFRTLLAARAPAVEPWCVNIPGHSRRCPGMLCVFDVNHGHEGVGPRQRPAWATSIYNLLKDERHQKKYSLGFKIALTLSRKWTAFVSSAQPATSTIAPKTGARRQVGIGVQQSRTPCRQNLFLRSIFLAQNVRWVEMIDSKKFTWLWAHISYGTYSQTCPYSIHRTVGPTI